VVIEWQSCGMHGRMHVTSRKYFSARTVPPPGTAASRIRICVRTVSLTLIRCDSYPAGRPATARPATVPTPRPARLQWPASHSPNPTAGKVAWRLCPLRMSFSLVLRLISSSRPPELLHMRAVRSSLFSWSRPVALPSSLDPLIQIMLASTF
jgi:hypothetical protein